MGTARVEGDGRRSVTRGAVERHVTPRMRVLIATIASYNCIGGCNTVTEECMVYANAARAYIDLHSLDLICQCRQWEAAR